MQISRRLDYRAIDIRDSGEPMSNQKVRRKRNTTKRQNKNTRVPASLRLSPGLIRRLEHYIADRRYEEQHRVERSEVAEEAMDKFLSDKGY